MEEELRDIAERQQFNVDKLVELVKENGMIIDQMKASEGLGICDSPQRHIALMNDTTSHHRTTYAAASFKM